MKLKTNIARLLAAGLLLNNIYFYSNANTLDNEIPGRYETLEGEYITIDDSTEGNLEEIEIFGNTVQDPNNLEDIQSVGDLYVDDKGNPILDKQGREQYKIDIVSSNKNLFNENWLMDGKDKTVLNGIEGYKVSSNPITTNNKTFTIHPKLLNKIYTITMSTLSLNPNDNGWANILIIYTDGSKYTVGDWLDKTSKSVTINTDKTIEYITFTSSLDFFVYDIQIEEGTDSTEYVSPQPATTTILLPTQLQKVKNVADRLYWDNKGRYVIEKNIKDVPLDFFQDKKFTKNATSEYRCMIGNAWNTFDSGPVRDRKIDSYTRYNIYSFADHGGNSIYVYYNINNLNKAGYLDEASETLYDAFFDDVISIKFVLKESSFIETNITEKLEIPTYEGKTYMFVETENEINPNLKVTVDRLPQIAKNAIEEAENDSTSYNISLARMYVNMLPESLYKDQLQEQLSEVFSSDITLDRNTVTSNLDIYIKSENMLSLSLDTNSITFERYSGVDAMEMLSAVNISINSSLPYDLNAYMPTEITNTDGSSTIDFDILNIKESSESTYQQFTDTINKVVLKSDCAKGNDINHSIDLKLDSSDAHKADVYKTVIKFEAEQK